jgi:DNA topoisomerase-2
MYVPELIFGHLLTSSNFDDSEKKTTGGRNGYGAKLANIFSTRFIIDTVDTANSEPGLGLKYTQVGLNINTLMSYALCPMPYDLFNPLCVICHMSYVICHKCLLTLPTQVFSENMTIKEKPAVRQTRSADYTCITFYPDLRRFGMTCLDEDIVALLSKVCLCVYGCMSIWVCGCMGVQEGVGAADVCVYCVYPPLPSTAHNAVSTTPTTPTTATINS